MRTLARCVLVAPLAALLACGNPGPAPGDGAPADALADALADSGSPLDSTSPHPDARADSAPRDTQNTLDSAPQNDTGTAPDVVARDTGSTGSTDAGTSAACPAAAFGARLGKTHLMIGGAMEDSSFSSQPFDIRYRYLAGSANATPCARCDTGCVVDGQDCSNSAGGCNWWGCWQYDQDPPGQYVTDHIASTRATGALPMISYYRWFTVAGSVEDAPEVAALNDGSRVSAYLHDWQFLMQVIARSSPEPVLVQIEPDLWGFVEHAGSDPTQVPVALSAAGMSACAGLGNNAAGFARCMLAIGRAEAPNALLAFHVSAWGHDRDALENTDPSYSITDHADETARFMRALGAAEGDLIVVEMSDRDAGFNNRWWDATDATLPNFAQALAWASRVGQQLNLGHVWWQVPLGDPNENDTCNHYRDNRVDYVFAHPDRFAATGSLGVAFGAGDGCGTTAESDNGYFLGKAAAYYSGSPPCLCGACP